MISILRLSVYCMRCIGVQCGEERVSHHSRSFVASLLMNGLARLPQRDALILHLSQLSSLTFSFSHRIEAESEF